MDIKYLDNLINGGLCPFCKKFYKPNGTGGEGMQILNQIIKNLPTDHVLRYGSCYHDWLYHIADRKTNMRSRLLR